MRFRTIVLAACITSVAMAQFGIGAEFVIQTDGQTIRLKAGVLQRTLEPKGGLLHTTSLKVAGEELLAADAKEFSLTISRAEPNQRPRGLKPDEAGEFESTATFGRNTDTLRVEETGGKAPVSQVRWIEPVAVEAAPSSGLSGPFVPKLEQPRLGVSRLTLSTPLANAGAIQDVTLALVYEVYEGHPAIRKWVRIHNRGQRWLKIDRLTIDVIVLSDGFRQKVALTPAERGAGSSVQAFGNADQSRGIIAVSEVPSALRNIDDSGAMGYAPDQFEWVLGPGEEFVSEPVFHYAYSGSVDKTISAVSTPLDRTVEGSYQKFLQTRVGLAGAANPPYAPSWSTWSNFGPAITDAIVREQADLAVRCGFAHLELDDGWQNDRLGTQPDAKKFPDFEATCRYVTAKGLKLGLWVSCFRSPDSPDMKALPEARSLPRIKRLGGYGMSFASPWREYYAHDLVRLHKQYGAVYFKQDFTDIRFGDLAEGHESRTRKDSLLRGLRGLLEAQDILRREAPAVSPEITHEIYWGTPGVPCDVAALKHAALYHIPPNDYSGVVNNKKRFSPSWNNDPVKLRQELLGGCFQARQRFYAHRGLPLYGIEWYAAATVNVNGSLSVEVQDRQICSWLMGAPLVFAGDLASLTEENIARYRRRFDLLKRLQSTYDIYRHFQFSGVPAPTDRDWHWWGKLDDKGYGAVVVLRGNGGAAQRAINVPWVHPEVEYRVTAAFSGKELGVFKGRELQAGSVQLELPALGQEILELAPASPAANH